MEKTTEQRFKALKKLARRVTPEEQIKRGFVALEATGLDREQIEDIAQSIGLDVESFAFGVAVPPYYGTTKPVQEMTQSSRATHVAEQHDPCVPTAKPRQADGPASLHCYEPRGDSTYSVMQERIAAAIERLANHFDPPPPNIVDTHYIASRLGCTREYASQMAKNGTIPTQCIVAGTGWGKVWRFYRSRVDRWIESR